MSSDDKDLLAAALDKVIIVSILSSCLLCFILQFGHYRKQIKAKKPFKKYLLRQIFDLEGKEEKPFVDHIIETLLESCFYM
jgi:hypothetical protein